MSILLEAKSVTLSAAVRGLTIAINNPILARTPSDNRTRFGRYLLEYMLHCLAHSVNSCYSASVAVSGDSY